MRPKMQDESAARLGSLDNQLYVVGVPIVHVIWHHPSRHTSGIHAPPPNMGLFADSFLPLFLVFSQHTKLKVSSPATTPIKD